MENREQEIEKLRNEMNAKLNNLASEEMKKEVYREPLRERMKRNKQTYDLVLENQRKTFFEYSVNKWSIPKDKQEELFKSYWDDFLAETTNSIAQFLESKGFSFPEEKRGILKIEGWDKKYD